MRPGEVGNASIAARQVRQNLTARGIGQCSKSSVQCSRRIFNHLVNYLAESLRRANIFYNSQKPRLGVWFAGLPILKRIENCESIRFASTTDRARANAFHFNVEALARARSVVEANLIDSQFSIL